MALIAFTALVLIALIALIGLAVLFAPKPEDDGEPPLGIGS